MKKKVILGVVILVMMFSAVVYAETKIENAISNDGRRSCKYVLATDFNRFPGANDHAGAETINTTSNPQYYDSRVYVSLYSYDGGYVQSAKTDYNGNLYILVEMNIICDEFGGMGMLLKADEWVSYAETDFFRLDY